MNQKFKKSIQQYACNEEETLSQIFKQAQVLGLRSPRRTPFMNRFLKLSLSVALVSVLALVTLTQFGIFNPFGGSNAVTAVYALDINPSFELSVNRADVVVKIVAVNDDAKTITTEDLLGLDSALVIQTLVQRATEAGFIDDTDLIEDFVLVTSIPMKDDSETQKQVDNLGQKIQALREADPTLQAISVATIKATKIELLEAQGKKIPVGLYVVNGMITSPDGTILSVKEFFSDPENRALIKNYGHITEVNLDKYRSRLILALNKLDRQGVNTISLRERITATSTEDELNVINNEIQILIEANKPGNGKPAK
jgi:hypothetical protein